MHQCKITILSIFVLIPTSLRINNIYSIYFTTISYTTIYYITIYYTTIYYTTIYYTTIYIYIYISRYVIYIDMHMCMFGNRWRSISQSLLSHCCFMSLEQIQGDHRQVPGLPVPKCRIEIRRCPKWPCCHLESASRRMGMSVFVFFFGIYIYIYIRATPGPGQSSGC